MYTNMMVSSGRGPMLLSDSSPDAYREIREVARDVARDCYAPRAAAWDAARTRFPKEEREYLGALGFLGTAEQRERYLPPIIRGEITMPVAISEPDAGSAATDMTTRAKLSAGTYTL